MSYQTYKVVLSPQFKNTLNLVANYYANEAGKDTAKRFLANVKSEVKGLDFMPNRHRCTDFNQSIRQVKINQFPYIVYYVVTDNLVYVLDLENGYKDPAKIALMLDEAMNKKAP